MRPVQGTLTGVGVVDDDETDLEIGGQLGFHRISSLNHIELFLTVDWLEVHDTVPLDGQPQAGDGDVHSMPGSTASSFGIISTSYNLLTTMRSVMTCPHR